jgi:hypothetical protein
MGGMDCIGRKRRSETCRESGDDMQEEWLKRSTIKHNSSGGSAAEMMIEDAISNTTAAGSTARARSSLSSVFLTLNSSPVVPGLIHL